MGWFYRRFEAGNTYPVETESFEKSVDLKRAKRKAAQESGLSFCLTRGKHICFIQAKEYLLGFFLVAAAAGGGAGLLSFGLVRLMASLAVLHDVLFLQFPAVDSSLNGSFFHGEQLMASLAVVQGFLMELMGKVHIAKRAALYYNIFCSGGKGGAGKTKGQNGNPYDDCFLEHNYLLEVR